MRRHITPGVVLAVVALVVAMSGSAYAAAKLTGAQIKDGTLTSADIKNHSLSSADMSGGALRALRGATGPAGPAGPAGLPGPAGPAGATGITSIVAVEADGTGAAMAYCPAGTRPVSGGGVDAGDGYLWASGAAQDEHGVGWLVAGNDDSPVTAFAYCSAGVAQITFPNGVKAAAAGRSGWLSLDKIDRLRAAR